MKKVCPWREKTMYCVIVGDIIDSKKIDTEVIDEINYAVKETLSYINTVYFDSILADFGMVRGDAFEGVLLTPYQVPQIINELIKAFYRAEKTKVRISVVLGELTTVSTDRNEANGPAFHKALDTLAKMKMKKSDHWFQVSIQVHSSAQPLLDSMMELISVLTENWTDRQREIVWAMEDLSEQQSLVSNKFGVSSPVINKQLKAAKYYAYRGAWINMEKYLYNIEELNIIENKENAISFLTYYNVAQRKNKTHNYEEAYDLFMKAQKTAVSELEKDDPQLILIYNGLAKNRIKAKKYEEAEKYINLSLEVQKDLPKARLGYAATTNLMGDLCLETSRIEEAKKYFESAIDIALNTVGKSHFFTSACYNNLAGVYRQEGIYGEALKYYDIELSFLTKHADCDPINLADVLYNMAYCYLQMGEFTKCEEYAERSLKVYKENLPPKHVYILSVKELLASIIKEGGELEK